MLKRPHSVAFSRAYKQALRLRVPFRQLFLDEEQKKKRACEFQASTALRLTRMGRSLSNRSLTAKRALALVGWRVDFGWLAFCCLSLVASAERTCSGPAANSGPVVERAADVAF